jgi:histidine triad (HIT) family protein
MTGERTDCIFCNIAAGAVPARAVYRDDDVIAIEDLHPQAPEHVLVLPTKHYRDVADLAGAGDAGVAAKLLQIAATIGEQRGGDRGFRIVANTGEDAGQTVDHLHFHVLAGRPMSWPPG